MKIFVLFLFLLASCAPSQDAIGQAVNETVAAMPTQTALPTYKPVPTWTRAPMSTRIPTFTAAPTVIPSPTIGLERQLSMTSEELQAIKSPLIVDHRPGFYLVAIDILPGIWRSQAQGNEGCYWAITDTVDEIMDNHFGLSGGTMWVPIPYDGPGGNPYQVEMGAECGTWKWLGWTP